MNELKNYYYKIYNKENGKLESVKHYSLNKTQDEMSEIAKKFNESESTKNVHKQVFDEDSIEMIRLCEKWRCSKSLEEVSDDLSDIEDTLRNAFYKIESISKDIKDKKDERIKELEEDLKEQKQLSNGLGKKLQSLMILYSAPRGKKDEYYYLLLDALEVLKFYETVDKNDEFIVGAKARDFLDKPEIKTILEGK